MPSSETILLTGVSGFLGREVLWNLLRRAEAGTQVYCLLRSDNGTDVEQRLQKLLVPEGEALPASARERCHAVSGDIVDDNLLMGPAMRERLVGAVERVSHCAATVRFTTPLP